MSRSTTCHNPPVGRSSDTLMPVSPRVEQRGVSLSHNGDTEAVERREITTGREAQAPGEGNSAESRSDVEGMDGENGTDDDEGVKEAWISIGRKSPKGPTRKEQDGHELTRMPFRSWCEDCVKS